MRFYDTCKAKFLHPMVNFLLFLCVVGYGVAVNYEKIELDDHKERVFNYKLGAAYWVLLTALILDIILHIMYRITKNTFLEFEIF